MKRASERERENQSNNNIQYQISSIRHIFVIAFCCNFADFPPIFVLFLLHQRILFVVFGELVGCTAVNLGVEILLLLSGQDIKTIFVFRFWRINKTNNNEKVSKCK